MKKEIKIIGIAASIIIIGLVSYNVYNSNFNCAGYSNFIKNKLDEFNNQNSCTIDADCILTTYDLCNPYGVQKNFNPGEFYSNLEKSRPISCPLASCIDPYMKYRPVCVNNSCSFIQK